MTAVVKTLSTHCPTHGQRDCAEIRCRVQTDKGACGLLTVMKPDEIAAMEPEFLSSFRAVE